MSQQTAAYEAKRAARRPGDVVYKVLLVEDNPGDARLIQTFLSEVQETTYELAGTAVRVSQANDFLKRNAVDAILLDLSLPDARGLETFERIRAHADAAAIVALTGLTDKSLAMEVVKAGAQDYLNKDEADGPVLDRVLRYAITRQRMQTKLDQARRNELGLKDQLLSHVSHELRSPLTPVYQLVTALMDGLTGELTEHQREVLEVIHRNVMQLRHLIDQLLEATRAGAGKLTVRPAVLALDELITACTQDHQRTADQKQVDLGAILPAQLPKVLADGERITQVLNNLTGNAIKFTPAGGRVALRAEPDDDGDWVRVSVQDTGCGIAAENVDRIFERLFQESTVDDRRKGLGLGLHISQEIVELHKGRIWVESEQGQGSTFSFTLPVFSTRRVLQKLADAHNAPSSLAILIVEVTPPKNGDKKVSDDSVSEIRDLVDRCTLPDLDTVMPRLAGDTSRERVIVVARADRDGAAVMRRRVDEQLQKSNCVQMGVVQISLRDFIVELSDTEASDRTEFLAAATRQVNAAMRESQSEEGGSK